MRKIFAFVLVIYLSACSDNSTSLLEHKKPENTVIPPNTLDVSIELPDYTITEDIITAPYKRSVEISLPSRTNEETLYALAEKIHSQSNIDVQRMRNTMMPIGQYHSSRSLFCSPVDLRKI